MNNSDLLSPEAPKFPRTDSLVFSITAQKNDSPHDTDLLKDSFPIQQNYCSSGQNYKKLRINQQSDIEPQVLTIPLSIVYSKGQSQSLPQNSASRQIQNLNNKLGILEYKIKSIKTQQAQPDEYLTFKDKFSVCSTKNFNKNQNQNINVSNLTADENIKVGKFFKRNQAKQAIKNNSNMYIVSNNNSLNVTKRRNRSLSHESRASQTTVQSQIFQKQSQIKSMRKQMLKLRMKIQKSQRSKSKCSQRLSESKQSIKNLMGQKKTNQRLITNLVKDLKKSENIRKKQKQTIAKQRQQINQLKKLVSILKGNLRG